MHILLVTNLFPTPLDPERGIFTLQLVKRLQKHCKVTVLCPLPWAPNIGLLNGTVWQQYSKISHNYFIEGITVISPKYFLIPKISENIHALLMSIGIKKQITELHKKFNFDAINSQWFYPDSVAVDKIANILKIPHIATGLGSDINRELYTPKKTKQIMKMLHSTSAISVVSNNLKDELVNRGITAKKITVIPNGIDTSRFKILNKKHCREALKIEESSITILYVGRLSIEKNIRTLIAAAANLISTNKSIKVYCLGDGSLKGELAEQVNTLGISKNITFKGKVDHTAVSLWLGACDLLCLPSTMEGCPNVILEALGCGRPVVASRVGAIPDIVTKESGILFTPQNIPELTYSLKTAIDTNWDEKNITESVKNLSWEEAAKHYFNVYQSAINHPLRETYK